MTKSDLEIVQHPQIDGMSMFFNTVNYRTMHMHSEWEILFVMDNEMDVQSMHQIMQAKPGDFVLINPFQPHEISSRKDGRACTFLCLQVSPELFAEAYPQINHIFGDEIIITPYFNASQLAKLKQLMFDTMRIYLEEKEGYELLCLSRSAEIMYQILQTIPCHTQTTREVEERDRRNERLIRLLQYVDDNYRYKVNLSDFAKAEGCTLNYMSAFVKEALNQTFQEYVKTVRFHCACKMIMNGNDKMQDVCMESGFSDYRYFSNTFRQRTGLTPEQYSHHPAVFMDAQQTHHSLHSLEHFYSRGRSIELLDQYEARIGS